MRWLNIPIFVATGVPIFGSGGSGGGGEKRKPTFWRDKYGFLKDRWIFAVVVGMAGVILFGSMLASDYFGRRACLSRGEQTGHVVKWAGPFPDARCYTQQADGSWLPGYVVVSR